jgi:hypothetical protein
MHDDIVQSPKGIWTCTVHIQLAIQFNNDRQYWKKILKRITAVIKLLASRGLPLKGDNHTIGSVKNENYLGIMEQLRQFDPFCMNTLKVS